VVSVFEFAVLALAIFRVIRFVIKDYLFDSFRQKVWDRFPPESTKTGYFLTCPWCVGFWVSLAFYSCYTIVPLQTMWIAVLFALSTLAGWLSALDDRF
jgi:hypothetical protein